MSPGNPVTCDFNEGVREMDGEDEVFVAPVGCDDSDDDHRESENVDPAVVVDVF